jgi:hypothetical protein
MQSALFVPIATQSVGTILSFIGGYMQFKKSISLLLFIGCVFLSSTAFADQDGDYTYTVSGGNATITGYTGAGGAISIPVTLGGYPTVAIGDNAFSGKTAVTGVTTK